MFDIIKKSQKDIEIFGGFRWAVVKNRLGQVCEIYHVDFYKFRRDKDTDGYWYSENWMKTRVEADYYKSFDPNDHEDTNSQIFSYNEYRPGCDWYPMPGYIGCNNYIELDIEISKFHLSNVRNGMHPSKMIQFYTGEPEETKKKAIEKRFRDKFSGSENTGKFVLVFNSSKEKTVDIEDLSGDENDKMFEVINKTVEQHIITGHEVVSPMLFGIKTEGQLGGNNELRTAYQMFINTYGKPKQDDLEKVINYFGMLMGKGQDYCIQQLDPVGIVVSDEMIAGVLTSEEIRELAGLPKIQTAGPVDGAAPIVQQQQERSANLNISMATLNKIVNIASKYKSGKLTYEQAMVAIKMYGLTDEEAEVFLVTPEEEALPAPQPVAMSQQLSEDDVIMMFDSCGDIKDDFHIITSKRKQKFDKQSAADYEATFFHGLYAGVDVTNAEASILDLIKKDKRITAEVIAKTIGSTPEYVTSKIASLTKRGVLSSVEVNVGEDVEIEREVVEKVKIPKDNETTQISVKYSYEVKPGVGKEIIETTRPFCRKLIKLNRLYSRAEIESISERLGYSVWDRRGGWWGDSPTCRHIWVSHIVVKKGNK